MKSIIFIFAVFSFNYLLTQAIYANISENVIKSENDWTEIDGIWPPLLEEWTLSANRSVKRESAKPDSKRKGRILRVPPAPNYYIAQDRNDDLEAKISGSKIVTNNHSNNNKKPPTGMVSETDLYLLSAIEKLVYKVDFMEKRLRRVEEMLYYNIAGNRIDTEPCPDRYTRVGANCYHFGSDAGREYDWKIASSQCKKLRGFLAEPEGTINMKELSAYILNKPNFLGKDFWLGGLNPGLLFIWSNSAKPVIESSNEQKNITIHGEGRCLKFAYNPALRTYLYKGADCSHRYSYICETTQNTASNELRRLGRSMKIITED